MSRKDERIDMLVARLAPVRDDDLVGALDTSEAAALFQAIVASAVGGRKSGGSTRRKRLLAIAVAAGVAAVLSIPAFGVGDQIASIFGGWKSEPDYPAPAPAGRDVVIASGKNGVAWKVVANRSDQGLCLGLVYGSRRSEEVGQASCGYVDLRGDLDPEIRGNPYTKCLLSPTEVVPCGSLPHRWIAFPYRTDPSPRFTGTGNELTRIIVVGTAAADVARVDLVLRNGKTVRAHVVEQPKGLGAALNFYWTRLPLGAATHGDRDLLIQMVIARGASGRVLERRVAAWNGNPTGDPDGPAPPEPLGE
jgi:hypothetical protein